MILPSKFSSPSFIPVDWVVTCQPSLVPRISPTPTDSIFPLRPSSALLGIGLVKSSESDNFPKSNSLGINSKSKLLFVASGSGLTVFGSPFPSGKLPPSNPTVTGVFPVVTACADKGAKLAPTTALPTNKLAKTFFFICTSPFTVWIARSR